LEKCQNLFRITKTMASVRDSFFTTVSHDPGARLLQNAKNIFVGHIAPDIDRPNRFALETQPFHQPEYGAAFVP
jgi:hypothetical protein